MYIGVCVCVYTAFWVDRGFLFSSLSLILDNERWKQADVPAEFQELVDYVASVHKLALPEKKTDKGKTKLT